MGAPSKKQSLIHRMNSIQHGYSSNRSHRSPCQTSRIENSLSLQVQWDYPPLTIHRFRFHWNWHGGLASIVRRGVDLLVCALIACSSLFVLFVLCGLW
jgi:hypothetical protein